MALTLTTVIGARPQFVKAAMVSRAFAAAGGVRETILHTGQHYDEALSDIFFAELEMPPPARNLGVGSAPQGAQTGRMLEAVEAALLADRPDWVLVYGDTNSTLAGALAAAKLHIPVAHVEAGMRSNNWAMPEEINRRIADQLSARLYTASAAAAANLRREGFAGGRIVAAGDVMYDATLHFKARDDATAARARLGLDAGGYVLATIHRAENTDEPRRLATIWHALERTAQRLPVVLPLHPRTAARLEAAGLAAHGGAIRVIAPVGYLDMLALEEGAQVIATDSGGVQKEAYFQRVPCVTLRTETEWVELIEAGWNRLAAPDDGDAIVDAIAAAAAPTASLAEVADYGDGHAAERIAADLAGQAR